MRRNDQVEELRARFTPSRKLSTAAKEMTVQDTLNSTIDEGMSVDPKVFLMGEEVCAALM